MTTWKPLNMAAMETMYLTETFTLFVSRMDIGPKNHPARVRLPLKLYRG